MFRSKVSLILIFALAYAFGAASAYAADNAWLCARGNGDWHNAANWSAGHVPNGSDNVTINCPPGLIVTVQMPASAATVMNVNTLQISTQGRLSAGVIQNDGTLQVGGFIQATPIRNNGTFNWLGGEINTYNTLNTGTLSIMGTADHFFNGGDLNNTGTLVHTAGPLRIGGSVINNGLYDFQAGSISGSNLNNSNTGTLRKSSSSTTTITANFNNSGGAITVLEGTLVFAGAGTSSGGSYTVAAGSNLVYRGTPTLNGTHSGNIEGSLRQEAGILYFRDPMTTVFNFAGTGFQWVSGELNYYNLRNDGLITVMGTGDHYFNGGDLNNAGTIVHANGPVRIAGNLINNNLYDFQAGSMAGGAFTNASEGTLRKSGDSNTLAVVGSSLSNLGSVEVAGGTLRITGPVAQLNFTTLTAGTWTVNNNATLDITSGNNIQTNNAAVTLTGPNAAFPKINTLQSNVGSFTLNAGRAFTAPGALTNSGTITLDAGSQLSVTTNYTQTADGTLAVTLGGLAPNQIGRLQVPGAAQLAGDLAPAVTDNFTPSEGDEFVILNYNMLNSIFDTCSGCALDGGLSLDTVYEQSQLKLVVIPE